MTLPEARREQAAFGLGLAWVDDALAGGAGRAGGGLHEILPAADADAAAASGFGAGLAHPLRAMAAAGLNATSSGYARPIAQAGGGRALCAGTFRLRAGSGTADPWSGVRDMVGVLRAGVEAARCPGLGAVIMEPWGNHRALDLTATRRLALAAEKSGVTVFLMRPGAREEASAALTRWRVAACPSIPAGCQRTWRSRLRRHPCCAQRAVAPAAWAGAWNGIMSPSITSDRPPPLSGAVFPVSWPSTGCRRAFQLARTGMTGRWRWSRRPATRSGWPPPDRAALAPFSA